MRTELEGATAISMAAYPPSAISAVSCPRRLPAAQVAVRYNETLGRYEVDALVKGAANLAHKRTCILALLEGAVEVRRRLLRGRHWCTRQGGTAARSTPRTTLLDLYP